MKKAGWIIGGGLLAVIVVVAAVLFFVVANLGDLIKTAIEEYGPPITKTTVKVAKVDIDATDGKGSMSGLFLGNPRGFKTPSALKLGKIAVALDVSSLTGNPIIIKSIVIDRPEVTYEKGDKLSNFDVIQRNVQNSLKEMTGGGSGGAKSSGGAQKKLIIRDLYIRNGTVNASLTAFQGKSLSTKLPDLHLHNIGQKSNGATAEEAVAQVMRALTRSIETSVSKLNLNALKGVADKAGDAAKKLGGAATKSGSDAGKKASDTLKSIFK